MKKLVKFALTLMLIAGVNIANAQGMSFTEAGHPYENAVLKNIRIGDDFQEACMKFEYLVKQYDPTVKLRTDKNSCGFGLLAFFGITADAEGVSMITIPMDYLGYDFSYDYSKIKKTAQDYLGSPNCMTPKLNSLTQFNKFEKRYDLWYYGYNPEGTVRLDINYLYMSMYKVNKGNF